MGKTRYWWWGAVKAMIREYPRLADKYRDVHTPRMTVDYGSPPSHGSGNPRTVEALALRELPPAEALVYNAVTAAIEDTRKKSTARERMRLIELVFWRRTYTLRGAAAALYVSYGTAKNWHNDFIRAVAKNYGYMM